VRKILLCTAVLLLPSAARAEEPDVTWTVSFADPMVELMHPVAGPPEEAAVAPQKLDLVVLGDGYTADQMSTFRADSERATKALLAAEPFATYASFVRIWRVNCVSANSGSAYDTRGPGDEVLHAKKDTCFGTYYTFAGGDKTAIGRALVVDALDNVSTVFGMVPDPDICLLLVNEPGRYGGAAGPSPGLCTSYNGPSMERIVVHELGHAIAGLGDEYNLEGNVYAGAEPANANFTIAGTDADAKWAPWIGVTFPLLGGKTDVVGRHEGGMGNAKGVFRPTADGCAMKHMSLPFCPVCREALVRLLWEAAEPIAASGSYPSPDDPSLVRVYMDDFVPSGQAKRSWWVNGEMRPATGAFAVPAGTRTYVDLPASTVGSAVGVVLDESPFLRIPRTDTGDPREFAYVEVRLAPLLEVK
jgi:hypothetical protein